MVNLSTVYAISIVLASVAGMGAAFVGHKFYPIKGGAAIPPPSPAEVYAEAQKTAALAQKLARAQIPPKPEETAEPVYTSSPEPEPAPSSSPEPTAPPEAEETPLPIASQSDIPEKEEEIPAQAPTDANNEPPAIPTYLPTPEEPEPQPTEEEDEENPKGGALGLQERIEQEFGMNEEFAANVMLFVTTPVEDWVQIASTQDELFQKFKDTLTDPELGKCPETLKDICKIVVVKYTNMEKLMNGKEYVPYGDQTEEATRLLSNTA